MQGRSARGAITRPLAAGLIGLALLAVPSDPSRSQPRFQRLESIDQSAVRTASAMFLEVRSQLAGQRPQDALFTLSVMTPDEHIGGAVANLNAVTRLLLGEDAQEEAFRYAELAVAADPDQPIFRVTRALARPNAYLRGADGSAILAQETVLELNAIARDLGTKIVNEKWLKTNLRALKETRDPAYPYDFERFDFMLSRVLVLPLDDRELRRQEDWIRQRIATDLDKLAGALRQQRLLEIQRNVILQDLAIVTDPEERRLLEQELDRVDQELLAWEQSLEETQTDLAYLAGQQQVLAFQSRQQQLLASEEQKIERDLVGLREDFRNRIVKLEGLVRRLRSDYETLQTDYGDMAALAEQRLQDLAKLEEAFAPQGPSESSALEALSARIRALEARKAALLAEQDQAVKTRSDGAEPGPALRGQIVKLDEQIAAARLNRDQLVQQLDSRDDTLQQLLSEKERQALMETRLAQVTDKLQTALDRLSLVNEGRAASEDRRRELKDSRAQVQAQIQELYNYRAGIQADRVKEGQRRRPDPAKIQGLDARLASVDDDIATKEASLSDIEDRLAALTDRDSVAAGLEREVAQYRQQQAQLQDRLGEVGLKVRGFQAIQARTETVVPPGELDFGRYHALIIANQRYQHWDDLDTPLADARALSRLLKTRFGFETRLVQNASRTDILSALESYDLLMGPEDRLLIYYAGHGQIRRDRGLGYWVPVDGELFNTANWISDDDLRRFLLGVDAGHVLVVADSCFSGTLASDAVSVKELARRPDFDQAAVVDFTRGRLVDRGAVLDTYLKHRARVVLSSGGERPVLDGYGDNGNSIFASSLTEALNRIEEPVSGRALASQVIEGLRVRIARDESLAAEKWVQVPQYEYLLTSAGHEFPADFVFTPVDWSPPKQTAMSLRDGGAQ